MKLRKHAYVLLSGGIDSTTCLYMAHAHNDIGVTAIGFDYGQRHKRELEYARLTCDQLGIVHQTIPLPDIIPTTMLTNKYTPLPDKSYSEIEGVSPAYVPFRNGLMLSALASIASGAYENMKRSWGYEGRNINGPEWRIYFGAHAEDSANWAYPDCTPEFVGAMANAIHVGTDGAVRLYTPLQWMNKAKIIQVGQRYGINWKLTWSCYEGGDVHCGRCPTCRARKAGFEAAGVKDPTTYA